MVSLGDDDDNNDVRSSSGGERKKRRNANNVRRREESHHHYTENVKQNWHCYQMDNVKRLSSLLKGVPTPRSG